MAMADFTNVIQSVAGMMKVQSRISTIVFYIIIIFTATELPLSKAFKT